MAERDQVGGALRRLDPGDLRDHERVALRQGPKARRGLGRHLDGRLRDGSAAGQRLPADVDHRDVARCPRRRGRDRSRESLAQQMEEAGAVAADAQRPVPPRRRRAARRARRGTRRPRSPSTDTTSRDGCRPRSTSENLTCDSACSPCLPWVRPSPDAPRPPHGACIAPKEYAWSLCQTEPARRARRSSLSRAHGRVSRPTHRARTASRSPSAIASRTSSNATTVTTGPKISSRRIRAVDGSPTSTVGSWNQPGSPIVRALPAADHARAVLGGVGDDVLDDAALALAHERPELGRRVVPVADPEPGERGRRGARRTRRGACGRRRCARPRSTPARSSQTPPTARPRLRGRDRRRRGRASDPCRPSSSVIGHSRSRRPRLRPACRSPSSP